MKIARILHDGTERLARVDDTHAHLLDVDASSPLAVLLGDPAPAGVTSSTSRAGSADQPPGAEAEPNRGSSDTDADAETGAGPDTAREAAEVPLADVQLLAPVARPGTVFAIGLNYADHARESGMATPERPVVFSKAAQSIVGPDATITWATAASSEVDYEAELACVIADEVRNVSPAEALDHVLGYTCCNDVSARDLQFSDGQWLRSKSFDTFCPLGPWLVTPDELGDPQQLAISCRLNGEVLQESTTAEMIFSVAEVISFLSQVLTLLPGDVITTGTPAGVGFARTPPVFLGDGDVVEVDIEGIGVLRNPCATT